MCYKEYSSNPLIKTLLSDHISDTNKLSPLSEANPLIRQIVHCGSGGLIRGGLLDYSIVTLVFPMSKIDNSYPSDNDNALKC